MYRSDKMLRLKELRKKKGLSQQQLADILGVTQATLSGWENGKYEIDHTGLSKCADFFHISVDYLLGRTSSLGLPHMRPNTYGLRGVWAGSLGMYMSILRNKGNRKIGAAELSRLTGIEYNRMEKIIFSPSISTIDLSADEIKKISDVFGITEDMFQDFFIPEERLHEFRLGSPVLNEEGMNKVNEYIEVLSESKKYTEQREEIADDIEAEIANDLKKHTANNISAK